MGWGAGACEEIFQGQGRGWSFKMLSIKNVLFALISFPTLSGDPNLGRFPLNLSNIAELVRRGGYAYIFGHIPPPSNLFRKFLGPP